MERWTALSCENDYGCIDTERILLPSNIAESIHSRGHVDAILVEELTKKFRPGWPGLPPVIALAGLSLSVHKGEIYGFLGPNGAGKTTTLKILLSLMRATSGKIEMLGKPAGER